MWPRGRALSMFAEARGFRVRGSARGSRDSGYEQEETEVTKDKEAGVAGRGSGVGGRNEEHGVRSCSSRHVPAACAGAWVLKFFVFFAKYQLLESFAGSLYLDAWRRSLASNYFCPWRNREAAHSG